MVNRVHAAYLYVQFVVDHLNREQFNTATVAFVHVDCQKLFMQNIQSVLCLLSRMDQEQQ